MDLIRYPEAAEILGIKQPTLRKWVSRRKVPHFKREGTVWFDREELVGWVEGGRVDIRKPRRVEAVKL